MPVATGQWDTVHEIPWPRIGLLEFLGVYAAKTAGVTLPPSLAPGRYRVRYPLMGPEAEGGGAFAMADQVGGEFEVGQ